MTFYLGVIFSCFQGIEPRHKTLFFTVYTHQHVQNRIHVQGLKDGQGGDGIHGGDQGPKCEGLDEVQGVDDLRLAEEKDSAAHDQGRDDRARNGEQEDAPDVREEIACAKKGMGNC